jgi:hypothetical protein
MKAHAINFAVTVAAVIAGLVLAPKVMGMIAPKG